MCVMVASAHGILLAIPCVERNDARLLRFIRRAQSAHGGRQQEAKMSLLFWYLPFMIMSGALDTLYPGENRRDETRLTDPETRNV
jgi:hypothetical protein